MWNTLVFSVVRENVFTDGTVIFAPLAYGAHLGAQVCSLPLADTSKSCFHPCFVIQKIVFGEGLFICATCTSRQYFHSASDLDK
jgi:hypothetical protein